jgi:2-polyprenyl-3-methyl-5-hydroxy-6-metoxy-1,4-benzoquinol methylase
MSELDKESIRKFWVKRSGKLMDAEIKESITNLENDKDLVVTKVEIERNILHQHISNAPFKDSLLDLGAGFGFWSQQFHSEFNEITAVEYSDELVKYGKEQLLLNKIKNIDLICSDVCEYKIDQNYDVVLVSGLFLYLNNADIVNILCKIRNACISTCRIILRDGMSLLNKDYTLNNKYSGALDDNYSAIYRTPENYKKIFEGLGFKLLEEQDMFTDESGLNKWQETKLRVMVFDLNGKFNK